MSHGWFFSGGHPLLIHFGGDLPEHASQASTRPPVMMVLFISGLFWYHDYWLFIAAWMSFLGFMENLRLRR